MVSNRPMRTTPPTKKINGSTSRRPTPSVDITAARKALVLQGGGALGAYQAGVYAGVYEKHKALDWVAGVSIGAINAALIAGNAPDMLVDLAPVNLGAVSRPQRMRLSSLRGHGALMRACTSLR